MTVFILLLFIIVKQFVILIWQIVWWIATRNKKPTRRTGKISIHLAGQNTVKIQIFFKIVEQSMNHFSKYWGSQKVTFNFHFMIRWVQNEDENRNLIDPPEMEPIHHFHCEIVFMLLFGFNRAYKCWYHHFISNKTEYSDSFCDFLLFLYAYSLKSALQTLYQLA